MAGGKKDRGLEINEQIRDRELRVIDADGSQLGVLPLAQAMKLAEDQDLDLVKIAPQATPPVVKVMDYGKYRFELQKKEKEQRKNQKIVETKEIRLSVNIDIGDFNTKLRNAKKFLAMGDKLKVSIRFRGREMAHANKGLEVHRRFAEALPDTVMERPPKLEGRQMIMYLAPEKEKEQPKGTKKEGAARPAPAQPQAAKPVAPAEKKPAPAPKEEAAKKQEE